MQLIFEMYFNGKPVNADIVQVIMLERDTWISVLVWAKQVGLQQTRPFSWGCCVSVSPRKSLFALVVGGSNQIQIISIPKSVLVLILACLGWCCSFSSSLTFSSCCYAPFHQRIDMPVQTSPLSHLVLHALLLLFLYSTVMWLSGATESRTQRDTWSADDWRDHSLKQRESRVRGYFVKVSENIAILYMRIHQLERYWYQYQQHQSCIYLLLWYQMDT